MRRVEKFYQLTWMEAIVMAAVALARLSFFNGFCNTSKLPKPIIVIWWGNCELYP
jgi:porphobilinogen deaminase